MHVFFSSRRRHTRLQGDWSSGVLFRSPRCALRGRGRPDRPADRPEFIPRFRTEDSRRRREMYRAEEYRRSAEEGFAGPDRKRVGRGKRVELGGRGVVKKKKSHTAGASV